MIPQLRSRNTIRFLSLSGSGLVLSRMKMLLIKLMVGLPAAGVAGDGACACGG